MATMVDNYGLSEKELAFIKEDAESMDFEFIRYADELTVTIYAHQPCKGENFKADFDVLIDGMSEDERGNGYFGYSYTREDLAKKMSE